MNKLKHIKDSFMIDSSGRNFFIRLFSSWIVAAFLLTIGSKDFLNLDFCKQNLILLFLAYGIGAFVALTALRVSFSWLNDEFLLLAVTLLYAVRILFTNTDVYFLLGVAVFTSMIYLYCYAEIKNYSKKVTISNKQMWFVIAVVAVIVTAFVSKITIVKYLSSKTSTYDLGIFIQTFYNLKEHFTLDNTCERNQAISHLQVHTSLFYYLLAPLYRLFPKAQTLLILQAVSVASGVIPLILLAKKKNITNKAAIGVAFVYLYSIGAWGGCFYDFHENVFLLPLLLWCFYFFEAGKTAFLFITALLVCTVKEDAPLYILILAFYMIFSHGIRAWKKTLGLLVLGLASMGGAFAFLSKHDFGLMTYRFNNIMSEEGNLLSIIKVILTNPGYLFTQAFNADKLPFIIVVFLPVICVILKTKKYHHFILLIPVVFINLLPEYQYMHNIFFQYTFATIAFIMYLFLVNLADMKAGKQKKWMGLAICLTLLTFCSQIPNQAHYLESYKNNKETYQTIKKGMDIIPDDASVIATAFFVPQMASREEVYTLEPDDIKEGKTFDTDYVVLDMRENYAIDNIEDAIKLYEASGYKTAYEAEGSILILQK